MAAIVRLNLRIAVLVVGLAVPAAAQQTGSITGTIVDARDGTPLEKVSVRVQDTKLAVLTTSDGRFQLDDVPAGRQEVFVSSVDFILVRRVVDVVAGATLDITIPIAAGTGTYSETVNVSGGADESPAAAQQVLRSNELQQLRGVITNDPMRAIHVLPGVATGDDLRSEFSVRGLPVRNMNFTFEGVATPLLVHTVQGVQDGGSIAMVNGDVLNEITLSAGSYAQRYGNHTGAELNFLMREGSRDRVRGQLRPSVTDTSMVLEGPMGSAKRGSWLISARKSYLGAVIRRIDPENTFAFGFHDAQVKIVRDVAPAHQLQVAFTVGRSRLDQDPAFVGIDEVKDGVNDVAVAVISWRYLVTPRFILTQRISADGNASRNVNRDGVELHRGRRSDVMYRADWTYSRSPALTFEGSGDVRRSKESRFDQGFLLSPEFALRESYSASALAAGSYALARIAKGRAIFAPGIRVDHSTLSGHTSARRRPRLLAGRDPGSGGGAGRSPDRTDDPARTAGSDDQSSGLRGWSRPSRHLGQFGRSANGRLRLQMDGRKPLQQAYPVRLGRPRLRLRTKRKPLSKADPDAADGFRWRRPTSLLGLAPRSLPDLSGRADRRRVGADPLSHPQHEHADGHRRARRHSHRGDGRHGHGRDVGGRVVARGRGRALSSPGR